MKFYLQSFKTLLSFVELSEKLGGLAQIWAWVVLIMGLFTVSFYLGLGLQARSGSSSMTHHEKVDF